MFLTDMVKINVFFFIYIKYQLLQSMLIKNYFLIFTDTLWTEKYNLLKYNETFSKIQVFRLNFRPTVSIIIINFISWPPQPLCRPGLNSNLNSIQSTTIHLSNPEDYGFDINIDCLWLILHVSHPLRCLIFKYYFNSKS